MKHRGAKRNILKTSEDLRTCLITAGSSQQYPGDYVLFREDGNSVGVYLVGSGKVRMSVRDMPSLDRDFDTGSLLGLPATFTGHTYSLTAITLVQSEIVHVPRQRFLELMRERPELCREATDMLGREATFIQSALAERRRQLATAV